MEMANFTYQDRYGNIKVRTDHTKCVNCGLCIAACHHGAREYNDDTERFFEDIAAGVPLSLIAAPSIRTNIPKYKRLFTYLKNLGVNTIFDASLGADICIWAHVKHIEKNGTAPIIAQPCSAIVLYCEKYRHDLLPKLSPIHSPIACTAIYMKEYKGITDSIAALTPCIAKSNEFASTNLSQYNVTFAKLLKSLETRNIALPQEETEFDNAECGLGSIFPMPGGFRDNIELGTELILGKKICVSRAEGIDVYHKLNTYADMPEEQLPAIFDVLSCVGGCNAGPAASCTLNTFEIESAMRRIKNAVSEEHRRQFYTSLYQDYDSTLDLPLFIRQYHPIDNVIPDVTEEDIRQAFDLLKKSNFAKRHIDCGACGSKSCYGMARKIALGVNFPSYCIFKALDDAEEEHERNAAIREQFAYIKKEHELDARIKSVLETNPQINILFDSNFRVIDCNPAALKLMGFETKEECIAEFFNRIAQSKPAFQSDGSPSVPLLERLVTASEFGQLKYEVELILSGVKRILDVEIRRMPFENSFGLVAYLFDLTDIREKEIELVQTKEQRSTAESASRAKSDFVSTVSHEIRTPMNAILGITEMQLQNRALSQETREALWKIYTAGELLLSIVNDILDLSKIESGKLEITPVKYDLASLVNDVVTLNIMRIGSKPINLRVTVDESSPATLFGDVLRIKQVLNNVLSNAIKYTESGTIDLSVSTERKIDSDVVLVLKVKDTGQGMTEEQVSVLFEKYTRFNEEANRTTEGTGLGMNITQNLVRLMNGEITVESELGIGSIFTVRLPQGAGMMLVGREVANNLKKRSPSGIRREKKSQVVYEQMPEGRVLIVDDVESNLYVATGLLTPYGITVETAVSGFETIDKIKEGNEYDIIFMDHMMPKMDGIETVKRLREMGYNLPIVALTANAVLGQANVFQSNGFDGFLSKPVDVRQLNTVLKKFVQGKQYSGIFFDAAIRQRDDLVEKKELQPPPEVEITPKLAEIFLWDARKAVVTLKAVYERHKVFNREDISIYTITVHAMKSALANVGESELSGWAAKLERAGQTMDISVITDETPQFLDALRLVIEKLSERAKESKKGVGASVGDIVHLREKLLLIREASERFEIQLAKDTLAELRAKSWSPVIEGHLSVMSTLLLNGDFEEIPQKIGETMASLT